MSVVVVVVVVVVVILPTRCGRNELEGLTQLLRYGHIPAGCCGITLHPHWRKNAYPVTMFTDCPVVSWRLCCRFRRSIFDFDIISVDHPCSALPSIALLLLFSTAPTTSFTTISNITLILLLFPLPPSSRPRPLSLFLLSPFVLLLFTIRQRT